MQARLRSNKRTSVKKSLADQDNECDGIATRCPHAPAGASNVPGISTPGLFSLVECVRYVYPPRDCIVLTPIDILCLAQSMRISSRQYPLLIKSVLRCGED